MHRVHRHLLLATSLALALAGGVAALAARQHAQRFDPSQDTASICSPDHPYSEEAIAEPAKHAFGIAVPAANPLPGQEDVRTYLVEKDDVVQLDLTATRGGSVAVHGIFEEHRLRPGATAFVKLRVKYKGRFPVHFHGDDGSHFAVAVFEVR